MIGDDKSTHKNQNGIGNRLKSQPAETELVEKPLNSLESLND